MTTVCIMQPTYLPWAGYFDLIDQSDVFVLLDTVAVSPKSWQTRNRIRARDGNVVWLSVPTNARRGMPLNEVLISNEHDWQAKHARSLTLAYAHAPHYADVLDPVTQYVRDAQWPSLAEHNAALIRALIVTLQLSATTVLMASSLGRPSADPYERIADICRHVGATELLNTPGAREWLEGHDVGVPVRWHQYEHPTYSQGDAPFCSHLSVVDLLAWHGPASLDIIRSGRR